VRRFWGIAALALLCALTRARALLVDKGDANVDTVYHVAAVWLHGTLPYIAAWEYKPPGIFAAAAVALVVFRTASLANAILGTVAVFVTALGAAAIVRRFGGSVRDASLAAIGIVLFSVEDQGVLGDAEVYVNACVTAGIAAAGSRRAWPGRAAYAGLAAAAALQVKLIALPLVVAIGVALVARVPAARARVLAIFAGVACAPFLFEAWLYARAGVFAEFWDANVEATLRRAATLRGGLRRDNAPQWFAQWRVLAPAVELAPFALLHSQRAALVPLWFWLAAAALAVAGTGEFYDRHFLLLVPPAVSLGTFGLAALLERFERPRTLLATVGVLTFALHGYYEVAQSIGIVAHRTAGRDRVWRAGHYPLVREAVRAALGDDRSLYVIEDSPRLYDDTGAAPPTAYAFSGDLLEPPMWPMLGFRGREELLRVLATRPHIIAVGTLGGNFDPAGVAAIRALLAKEYRFVGEADRTAIYRLRALATQSRPSTSSTW